MMSGAEADISSDGETSFEDEDVPLPKSPLKEGTDEPFQVILKGGKPWGFSLGGGTEFRSPVHIAEIDEDGKAAENGQLKTGDYVLQVNNIPCNSLAEAEELIESAFRTLTLQMWRGTTGDTVTSPTRSASFLQKARELSERARQAAQDDTALFSEAKRMKPRQRRIESFHGSRRGSAQSSSNSSVTTSVASPVTAIPPFTPPTSTAEGTTVTKPPLKGWATEHDLSSQHKPVIMSSTHAAVPSSRHMPLTPAKSSPSLNQDEALGIGASPRNYKPKTPPTLNLAKSTPDIPDHISYDHVTSPTSPKSPSWYQKFPNRSMTFDFPAPNIRRSPRNSYAGGSPRNSYSSGSPRNSYAGGSPRSSFSGYSSYYSPQSAVTGFSPSSLPSSTGLSQPTDSNSTSQRTSASVGYSHTNKLLGANTVSYDDTPSPSQNKNYDRRSLPPQSLYQIRHEFQREQNKTETQKQLHSMPVTREEEEADKEVKPRPPTDLDVRPMYNPPAPPVRDISSLKYVSYHQNHEKYPSWPVTTANPPQNLGPPVDAQMADAVRDKGLDIDKTDKSKDTVNKSSDRNSASSELRTSEETNKSRNQSDPGFNKGPKLSFYTTRKPNYVGSKEPDYENIKTEEERFNDFFQKSQPGYPPPQLDPDGHNYGDEKYSIPSPPERDMPNLDEKSLVEKIAAVISPGSTHQPSSFQYHPQYHSTVEMGTPRSTGKADVGVGGQAPKVQGTYFQQAMNAQNLLRTSTSNMSQGKTMVDSGTSPIHSPSDEKVKFSHKPITPNTNIHTESIVSPPEQKTRGLIIKQMPYYNTSTQTDDLGNRNSMSEAGDHSEQSQSSGFSSMTFSDHSSAPMLRKLSEEFYRGKLSGTVANEKRMSSASAYDDLKSPRSESHYGSLKEAESYSSVVIHPHESVGPFGKDDFGSSPSLISSRPEVSDTEHDNSSEHRLFNKGRYSMDSTGLQKPPGTLGVIPRSLNESRFTSESNLSSGSASGRNQIYSQSLLHLNRPSSSMGERSRSYQNSSESSTSSRPQGSLEARSSGSRISSGSSVSELSAHRTTDSRNNSDSVFVYDKSEISGGIQNSDQQSRTQSAGVGRKESMKLAYGTYDEHEHHYATPYGHQRNNSEVLSSNTYDPNIVHNRSASYSTSDYLPMHYNPATGESSRLGQIREEGSEVRWQEAVQKSRSLSRDGPSNYENFHVESQSPLKNSNGDKRESGTGMRRTVSEQIRPKKSDKKAQKAAENQALRKDYSSSSGESSKENKSDSESKSMSQHLSDSNLKQMQQKAVLDFVERKSKESRSSDSSEPHSPKPDGSQTPEGKGSSSPSAAPHSPIPDISKRYHYTKAQRNESLKRTRSISSNSSKDSTDYMEMKRLQPNFQTEWSRLRSQEGAMPRRPLSIGSDLGAGDNIMATSSPIPTPDESSKSMDETLVKKVIENEEKTEANSNQNDGPLPTHNDAMVTSPIYQNYGGDYPRRPPPPVPGISDEQPPAIPPRNYPRFNNSKSESFLLANLDKKQSGNLQETYKNGTLREDAYAQQLRRQARRFSEQPKPISMQVVSTKTTMQVNLTQSYKQEPVTVLEAMPMQKNSETSLSPPNRQKLSPTLRQVISPEPPPMPTPLKNGETEFKEDFNRPADFPPPPAEFVGQEGVGERSDGCAEDSYIWHKKRVHREVGKYSRTKSDTNILRVAQEVKPFRPDLTPRDGAETPNKPPRRKLDLHGRGSPVHGMRSSSPSMSGSDSQLVIPAQTAAMPTFPTAEVTNVQHAQKSMAQPLQSLSVQKLQSPSSNGGIVSTVVQKPSSSMEDMTLSVRDRIKNIEVFTHSPGSGNKSQKGDTSPDNSGQQRNVDSLEQLECSVKSSDSFRDRLRPVVRKVEHSEPDLSDQQTVPHTGTDKVPADVPDQFETPPQVPSRTYRQLGTSSGGASRDNDRPPRPYPKPSERADPTVRKANMQNHSPGLTHPRPYESKPGAAIYNPMSPAGYHKSGSPTEPQRSPGSADSSRSRSHSVPEPQVPTRQPSRGKHDEPASIKSRDQNENITSPEQKSTFQHSDDSARNKDNTQSNSVHIAQKRNYESSFPSSKSHSEQISPSNYKANSHSPSSSRQSSEPHNQHIPSYGNTHHKDNMGGKSRDSDSRASYSSEQRPRLHSDSRSPAHTPTYQRGDFRHWRSDSMQSPSEHRKDSHSPSAASVHSAGTVNENKAEKTVKPLVSVNHGRQPSAEELDCDKKAQELAKVLKDKDRELSQVLTTDSNKIRMQYLDGILPVDQEPLEQRRPRSASKKEDKTDAAKDGQEKDGKDANEPTSPMPSNYYVSPPKAMIELEIRKFGDTSQLTQDIDDNDTLAERKEELLQRMIKKLDILKEDKTELHGDIEENESLGKQVQEVVEKKCRSQQEKDKYKAYIEDIDKIIRLLLKLSGLLARAENTIQGLTENTNEKIKKMTYDKRDRLHKQHEDAKELKMDIDRRSEQIEVYLKECMSASELEDYHYYIKMKSKYTIQMQELEDKITLGNEQIAALRKSI